MSENNYNKIGGWLILVGIGVVVGPIRLLLTTVPLYSEMFQNGTWEALTNQSNETYTPYFDVILIAEISINLILFLASLFLIYLFFYKKRAFPKFFIGIILVSIAFIILDSWAITLIFPAEPMFDPDTAKELIRTVIYGLIWIPYMLISNRVRETFIEPLPNKAI